MLGNFKIFESIPKIPRRPRITSVTWSSLNHGATLAGEVTWRTLAPELRYARRHLPRPPPVQMMVAFLRTRSFVSVGISVLTVAQTLSLQCWFKHVCIHCSQPHKGKARTSVAGSSKRADKCTVNERDSFPLEDASFANLSPFEDCPLKFHAWEKDLLQACLSVLQGSSY